ncbi:penicillin-binding protein 2 [Patescibacteria group bacterium]|nr:penicillin-binding protein 2 [Patescibacteria group bacterium]MCL5091763.1 penicillin-binding protein 2 [Patescibacteria group bacterium]
MIKLRLLLVLFVVGYVLVYVKLFYLQTFNSLSSNANYVKTEKIQPSRGKISDRHLLPLAVNQIKYRLYVEPKHIGDKEQLVQRLAPSLSLSEASLEARIDMSKNWVSVAAGISPEMRRQIMKLKLNGVGFGEEPDRFYPEASLSAHLLGFVGKNAAGGAVGYFGVEGYYDKELTGLGGVVRSEQDLLGRPIFLGIQEKIDAENGRDLVLTIDNSVQAIIKGRLKNAMESYQAQQGCVIVVDPNNLEVLGLSCLPDFDPTTYYQFDEALYKNPAISNLYEPGSTFKPMVVAAALSDKAIKPNDTFEEAGPVTIGEYNIRTWDDKYEGKVSVTRILEKSSNVGMVAIGARLGNQKLYQALEKYGFGSPTGIDLQGEVGGYLKPKNQWYPIDFATATFGQGIAVTPIQMVKAFASIINGGNLFQPHVVKKLVSDHDEQTIPVKSLGRSVDAKTSEIIKRMLEATVNNGEVHWAKPAGYRIGGKTGTAQIAIKGHYDASKTIASFIGFVPVDQPKFLVLTILWEPKASQWGSETAAPLFFDIAKDLIVYYNISPDE